MVTLVLSLHLPLVARRCPPCKIQRNRGEGKQCFEDWRPPKGTNREKWNERTRFCRDETKVRQRSCDDDISTDDNSTTHL